MPARLFVDDCAAKSVTTLKWTYRTRASSIRVCSPSSAETVACIAGLSFTENFVATFPESGVSAPLPGVRRAGGHSATRCAQSSRFFELIVDSTEGLSAVAHRSQAAQARPDHSAHWQRDRVTSRWPCSRHFERHGIAMVNSPASVNSGRRQIANPANTLGREHSDSENHLGKFPVDVNG